MTPRTSMLASIPAMLLFLVGLPVAASQSQPSRLPQRFHALAVQLDAVPRQTTLPIDLLVTRWSTATEQKTVLDTVREHPDKLDETLRKMPGVGRLSTPGDVGYELRYSQKMSSGGTDRILLLTDRPVGFAEAVDNGRTRDYAVTVIELRIGASGQGEGKVAVAARLTVDPLSDQFVVEDWNISPVMLQGLERD